MYNHNFGATTMNTENKNFMDYQPKPESEIKLEIKRYEFRYVLIFAISALISCIVVAALLGPSDFSIQLNSIKLNKADLVLIYIPFLMLFLLLAIQHISRVFEKNTKTSRFPHPTLTEKINGTYALIIKDLCRKDPQFQQKVGEIIKFRGNKLLNIDFYAITKGYNILKLAKQVDKNVVEHELYQIIEDTSPCVHLSTTMFHEGLAQCFKCNATINSKREIVEPLNKDHKIN